jgi:hypothetical protein
MTDPNVAPPLFSSAHGGLSASTRAAVSARGDPATLNLDDIFGDVVFTPDGDTVFLSELGDEGHLNSGEGNNVANMASRPTATGSYAPVRPGGGVYTTQLQDSGKPSLAMGDFTQETKAVPYRKKPQADHHLQYAAPRKKSSASDASSGGKMSEQQKVERRYVL